MVKTEQKLTIGLKMKTLLAKNLKLQLNERDMTVAQLSRATKVPSQTLNNWLAGLEPRSMSQVKQIAKYFNLTIDELAYGEETKYPKQVLEQYKDEIFAGTFEVILRKVKK